MKTLNWLTRAQIFTWTVFATFFGFMANAQTGNNSPDLKVQVDTKSTEAMGGQDWMSNPLVWVIGALVLILIIALVARGGGSKD